MFVKLFHIREKSLKTMNVAFYVHSINPFFYILDTLLSGNVHMAHPVLFTQHASASLNLSFKQMC